MNERWTPESTPAFWINRASRSLIRHFDKRLRVLGFAMSHLPVLRALGDGRSHSQTELAQMAGVEQPTMAETLARMARDGVVMRTPDPQGGRRVAFSLTKDTRARFPRARLALVEADRIAMEGFSNEEKATLRALLERVVANIEASEAEEKE